MGSLGVHVRRVRGRPGAISGMVANTGPGGPFLNSHPAAPSLFHNLHLIYDERNRLTPSARGARWLPSIRQTRWSLPCFSLSLSISRLARSTSLLREQGQLLYSHPTS